MAASVPTAIPALQTLTEFPPTDQQYSSRRDASNPLETTKEMKMVCFPFQTSQYVWCPMNIDSIDGGGV